jgi:hypothetical protein
MGYSGRYILSFKINTFQEIALEQSPERRGNEPCRILKAKHSRENK